MQPRQPASWAQQCAPPPEPYQAMCPQHWGVPCQGDHRGKAPCPYVDDIKGLFPTTLTQWFLGLC